MLRLSRIFKNYNDTGSLSEQINLYGFIGPHVFLTKSGEVGLILEVRGVDYECLDSASIDGFTKRLESALKLFDENYRVYQYLFKRNNEVIPYKLYDNPIVDTAIKTRIAYLASKADKLFSLSVYYVVLYQGFQISHKLGSALAEFPTILLAAAQAVAIVVIAYGFIATAVCVLVGPVFVPFFIVPKLEWPFWGWFRCFLQYAFYQVIAAAVVYVIGNLMLGALRLPPPGTLSTVQLIAWFPVLFITFLASIYVLLKIPSLTNHIFSGTAGGPSAGLLDAPAAVLNRVM